MKRCLFFLLCLMGLSLAVPTQGHANPVCWLTGQWCDDPELLHETPVSPSRPSGESDGQTADRISKSLLCDTYGIVSGNLGLMAGFLLAVWGLYIWIRKDKLMAGVALIFVGAFLTAIPGLVISFLQGAYIVTSPLRPESIRETKQPIKMFSKACP